MKILNLIFDFFIYLKLEQENIISLQLLFHIINILGHLFSDPFNRKQLYDAILLLLC